MFKYKSKNLYQFKLNLKYKLKRMEFSMKFHEDMIFKRNGQKYGQELINILNIKGKIIKVHQTEYGIIDPKMYKPDLVFELEDRIIILEFQSSYIDIKDEKRFRFYSALLDQIKNKSNKYIEVHVMSTIEKEKRKCYKISEESRFPIYIHSLKNLDGDEFLNTMKTKIKNNQKLTKKELLLISLLCFMSSKTNTEQTILNSAKTITDIKNLNDDIGQFTKGVILMLCDKFVKDELINTKISNLVGGNMKIIEDYAQRVADKKAEETRIKTRKETKKETIKEFITKLNKNGLKTKEIAKYLELNEEYVIKTLNQ